MTLKTLKYSGIVAWNNTSYYNPVIEYSTSQLPYDGDLIIVKIEGGIIVVSYSNQERIEGVVTNVSNEHESNKTISGIAVSVALIIVVFCSLLMPSGAAAQSVQLINSTAEIKENISSMPGTKIDTVVVGIKMLKDYDTSEKKIKLVVSRSDFPNSPELKKDEFTIDEGWKKDEVHYLKVPISTYNVMEGIKEEKVAILIIEESQKEFVTLKLVKAHPYDPNKPFWIEAGANLDLIDGLQANNLFAGVFLYKRDIRRLKEKDRHPNLGMFAGVYESKTLTFSSENEFRGFTYYNNNSFFHPDSALIYTDTGSVSYRQQIRNVGLFFSPQLRLTNGSANEDGMHIFLSFWAELQWQRITNTLEASGVRRMDSNRISRADLSHYGPLVTTEEIDIRSHYIGGGFPVYMKWGNANLFFNPVIGGSNQPRESDLTRLFSDKNTPLTRIWYGFYVLQFRLSEEQYGFAFSGEVRGLLIDNSRPFVTLVLSKKFDLTKLIEFK